MRALFLGNNQIESRSGRFRVGTFVDREDDPVLSKSKEILTRLRVRRRCRKCYRPLERGRKHCGVRLNRSPLSRLPEIPILPPNPA